MLAKGIDIALTTVLMIAEVFVAGTAAAFIFLGMFDVSCLKNCDYGPTVFAVYLMAGISLVVTIAAGLGIGFARTYGKRSTWVPATAIAVLVIAYHGCIALQTVGA